MDDDTPGSKNEFDNVLVSQTQKTLAEIAKEEAKAVVRDVLSDEARAMDASKLDDHGSDESRRFDTSEFSLDDLGQKDYTEPAQQAGNIDDKLDNVVIVQAASQCVNKTHTQPDLLPEVQDKDQGFNIPVAPAPYQEIGKPPPKVADPEEPVWTTTAPSRVDPPKQDPGPQEETPELSTVTEEDGTRSVSEMSDMTNASSLPAEPQGAAAAAAAPAAELQGASSDGVIPPVKKKSFFKRLFSKKKSKDPNRTASEQITTTATSPAQAQI